MVVASGDPAVMLRFIRLFFFGDACFPAPGRLRSRRRDDAVASLPGTSSKPVGFVTLPWVRMIPQAGMSLSPRRGLSSTRLGSGRSTTVSGKCFESGAGGPRHEHMLTHCWSCPSQTVLPPTGAR